MIKVLFGISMLLSSVTLWASDRAGNGGDMCENRIKNIRDDIASWIKRGGPQYLTLPPSLSISTYEENMILAIQTAHISCVNGTVAVSGAEKTCVNFIDKNKTSQIQCNIDRFVNKTSDSDQYILIHHEFAGLSGFEVNNGDDSNYPISNQMSGFLVEQVIKKLAVKPQTNSTIKFANSAIKVTHQNLQSFGYTVEKITKDNLYECRGWYYDDFWHQICLPTGCVAQSTEKYSLHRFNINLKNGESYKGIECTSALKSDVKGRLIFIEIGRVDTSSCLKSETCDSSGACIKTFGIKTNIPVLLGSRDNEDILTDWLSTYDSDEVCR